MMLIKLKTSPSFVGSVVALLGVGAASRSATSRRAIARLGLAADKADANGPACDTMCEYV